MIESHPREDRSTLPHQTPDWKGWKLIIDLRKKSTNHSHNNIAIMRISSRSRFCSHLHILLLIMWCILTCSSQVDSFRSRGCWAGTGIRDLERSWGFTELHWDISTEEQRGPEHHEAQEEGAVAQPRPALDHQRGHTALRQYLDIYMSLNVYKFRYQR